MSIGWAVKQKGEINMRTIYPTEQGAMVNWLVVEAKCIVLDSHTFEDIQNAFETLRHAYGAKLVKVQITEI